MNGDEHGDRAAIMLGMVLLSVSGFLMGLLVMGLVWWAS